MLPSVVLPQVVVCWGVLWAKVGLLKLLGWAVSLSIAVMSVDALINASPVWVWCYIITVICPQRPPFMPPPMGSMPPPPGMMFPPGMPPVTAPGTPAMPPAEEIWVENKTPDGKVRWSPETADYWLVAAVVSVLLCSVLHAGTPDFLKKIAW